MDGCTRTDGASSHRTAPTSPVTRPELRRERAPTGDLAEDIRTFVLFALRCHVRALCRGERSPGAPRGDRCTSVSVMSTCCCSVYGRIMRVLS